MFENIFKENISKSIAKFEMTEFADFSTVTNK